MSNDEPLFDSDVDPKRIKNVADGLRRQGEFESARMLDSYAVMLAAATQQAAEPVVWMTPTKNYFGSFEGCTDACNGAPIPLYTHPQPAQDARDAARYRWMRGMRNRERAADLAKHKMNLDAAIDAAMAKGSGR